MPDLTPITREEMFLDGNTELTPITREEKILAGEDLDVITRREWFLKKYRSGGDITVESITITENGTTTAPSGKAYSPIYTNVGLPENAYLLKDFENVPSDIVTFNDGANLPMPSLKTTIVPIQSGSGDPSPSNVRPISGWSGANVSVCGKNLCDFADKTITEGAYVINNVPAYLPQGSYVLSFDFSGTTSTSSFRIDDKNGNSIFSTNKVVSEGRNTVSISLSQTGFYVKYYSNAVGEYSNFQIEQGATATTYEPYTGHTYTIPFTDSQGQPIEVFGGECDVVNGGGSAYKEYDSYNGETLIGPWISDRDVYAPNTSPTIGAQVVDMGDTSTFYTQPTSIKSIEGVNNVWGDCGQISEGSYFAKGEEE